MTLSVGLYRVSGDGRFEYVPYNPRLPRNDAAGGESWRTAYYGSERSRQLGLELLPTLGSGQDVFASGADLLTLAREVDVLRRDHARAVEEWKKTGDYVEADDFTLYCLQNIEEAVRVALESGYGVCIQ